MTKDLASGTVFKITDLKDEEINIDNLKIDDKIRVHWDEGLDLEYTVLGFADAGIYVHDRHFFSNPIFLRRKGPNVVTK